MMEYLEFANRLRGIARRADMFGHDRERLIEELIFAAENYEGVAERLEKQMIAQSQEEIAEAA